MSRSPVDEYAEISREVGETIARMEPGDRERRARGARQ